jgi:hypothetical protein
MRSEEQQQHHKVATLGIPCLSFLWTTIDGYVPGASLAQGESTKALLGIFIFIGYILGTALATFLLRKEVHNTVGLSTKVS